MWESFHNKSVSTVCWENVSVNNYVEMYKKSFNKTTFYTLKTKLLWKENFQKFW